MNQAQNDRGNGSSETTIYFVVPLMPMAPQSDGLPTESLVRCAYFDTAWKPVDSKNLVTDANSNVITFLQQGEVSASVLKYLQDQYGSEPDTGVSMFAAVAKTLKFDTDLPRTFLASGHRGAASIDVQVQLNSARGVVLIFRKPAEGGAQKLIATADPEIRNGSGG